MFSLIFVSIAMGPPPQAPAVKCPPQAPAVRAWKEPTKAVVKVTYRQPSGHTHTCLVDGETWDHDKNPTHNCPICGREQLRVDQPSRMVQVRTQTTQVVVQKMEVAPVQYFLPQATTSVCGPNGCSTPQATQNSRLFAPFGGRFR